MADPSDALDIPASLVRTGEPIKQICLRLPLSFWEEFCSFAEDLDDKELFEKLGNIVREDAAAPPEDSESAHAALGILNQQFDGFVSTINRRIEMLSHQSDLHFRAIILSLDAFRAEMRAHLCTLRLNQPCAEANQLTFIAERMAKLEAKVKQQASRRQTQGNHPVD